MCIGWVGEHRLIGVEHWRGDSGGEGGEKEEDIDRSLNDSIVLLCGWYDLRRRYIIISKGDLLV